MQDIRMSRLIIMINIFSVQLYFNYIFVAKDAEWQPWGEWSHCTASCGKGIQVRARVCDGEAFGGDEVCPHGNSTEIQECDDADCQSKYCIHFCHIIYGFLSINCFLERY